MMCLDIFANVFRRHATKKLWSLKFSWPELFRDSALKTRLDGWILPSLEVTDETLKGALSHNITPIVVHGVELC